MRTALIIGCMLMGTRVFSQGLPQKTYTDTAKAPFATFRQPANMQVQQATSIPQNFYAQHMAFFCKQELKLQQVHVPLSIRVGDIEQCNKLEQKPGYR